MGDHIIVGFSPLPPVVFVRFTLGVCLKSQVTVSSVTDLVCWPGDTSGAPNDSFWKISVRKTI